MSFIAITGPWLSLRVRTYGASRALRQIAWQLAWSAGLCLICLSGFFGGFLGASAAGQATEPPARIVALGDSLTAGLGLPEKEGFVARLQAALTANGIAAQITSAGVSGDTAADGLARLDWSVPEGTDAVIVELGANDMLRGIDPQVTRAALDGILHRLTARHIAVLLCGMKAAPNLGLDYGQAFGRIFPELAAKYGVFFYPFFLDGAAGNLALLQRDGMHPNAAGVDVIVSHILPKVEELVVRARRSP